MAYENLHKAGELVQWFRALTALAEVSGSVLSIHTAATTVYNSSLRGIQHPLLTSMGTRHVVHRPTCRQNTHTLIIITTTIIIIIIIVVAVIVIWWLTECQDREPGSVSRSIVGQRRFQEQSAFHSDHIWLLSGDIVSLLYLLLKQNPQPISRWNKSSDTLAVAKSR